MSGSNQENKQDLESNQQQLNFPANAFILITSGATSGKLFTKIMPDISDILKENKQKT